MNATEAITALPPRDLEGLYDAMRVVTEGFRGVGHVAIANFYDRCGAALDAERSRRQAGCASFELGGESALREAAAALDDRQLVIVAMALLAVAIEPWAAPGRPFLVYLAEIVHAERLQRQGGLQC